YILLQRTKMLDVRDRPDHGEGGDPKLQENEEQLGAEAPVGKAFHDVLPGRVTAANPRSTRPPGRSNRSGVTHPGRRRYHRDRTRKTGCSLSSGGTPGISSYRRTRDDGHGRCG